MNFPMMEFLLSAAPKNMNVTTKYPEDFFNYLYSCSNAKCCNCDLDCMETRTCCIDKLWNKNESITLDEYLIKFKEEAMKSKTRSCLPIITSPAFYSFNIDYYLMIDSCVTNDFNTKLCLNDTLVPQEERIPVYGIDGYVYKNAYCARCNSVETFYIANYTLECNSRVPKFAPPPLPGVENVTVAKETGQDYFKDFQTCYIGLEKTQLPITNLKYKTCYPKQMKTKSCKNNMHKELCSLYNGEVGDYANIHCYACNEGNFKNIPFPGGQCTDSSPGRVTTWSITINYGGQITTTSKSTGYMESKQFCKDGEIFSLVDGSCKLFTCGEGFQLNGTSCIKIKTDLNIHISDPNYQRCLKALPIYLFVLMKNNTNVDYKNFTKMFEKEFNITQSNFNFLYADKYKQNNS